MTNFARSQYEEGSCTESLKKKVKKKWTCLKLSIRNYQPHANPTSKKVSAPRLLSLSCKGQIQTVTNKEEEKIQKHKLKVKEWRKMYHVNAKQKES